MLDRQTVSHTKLEPGSCEEISAFHEAALRNSSSSGRMRPNSTAQLISDSIGAELANVEQLLNESLTSRYPEVQALSNRAASLGGKRLRPMLVLLFADATAGPPQPLSPRQRVDARRTAVAVELVHAASLVHDDVMDHATQRRHQPTVSHACGNSQAVLLGDFLFTRAYAAAASCSQRGVARQLAAAATQLCEGELRQQTSAGNWLLSYQEYRSILNQKTGALIAASCRLGCSVARGSRDQQRAAQRFGMALGLAFQIHDDWLDYWGEGSQVGKTLGTDLFQFKPTLPLMRLLKTSSPRQRHELTDWLHCGSDASRERVRAALDRSDAQAYTLATARRWVEKAKRELIAFPASTAIQCVTAIADFSVRRAC